MRYLSRCRAVCKWTAYERYQAGDQSGEAGGDPGGPPRVRCRVFARCGYEAATVEDIMESAGFSRGAFYSNFDSKKNSP
jgi:hypothetical protein